MELIAKDDSSDMNLKLLEKYNIPATFQESNKAEILAALARDPDFFKFDFLSGPTYEKMRVKKRTLHWMPLNHETKSSKKHKHKTKFARPATNGLIESLNVCDTIYIENMDMDESWELPLPCYCTIARSQLLKDLELPEPLMNILEQMRTKSVVEIVEFLKECGGEIGSSSVANSGCRVRLLLVIRDLLVGEASLRKPSTSQPETAGKSWLCGGQLNTKLDLKRKVFDQGQNASEVPVAKQNKTVATATVTSASNLESSVAVSATSSSVLSAASDSDAIKNFNNSPGSSSSPPSSVEAKKEFLSQQFSKNLAQQRPKWMCNNSDVPPGSATSTTSSVFNQSPLSQRLVLDCRVCYVKRCGAAFSPCGHIACCFSCAQNCNECPLCRKRVRSVLQVYFSTA